MPISIADFNERTDDELKLDDGPNLYRQKILAFLYASKDSAFTSAEIAKGIGRKYLGKTLPDLVKKGFIKRKGDFFTYAGGKPPLPLAEEKPAKPKRVPAILRDDGRKRRADTLEDLPEEGEDLKPGDDDYVEYVDEVRGK